MSTQRDWTLAEILIGDSGFELPKPVDLKHIQAVLITTPHITRTVDNDIVEIKTQDALYRILKTQYQKIQSGDYL